MVIPTQEKIDNLSAEDILNLTKEEVEVLNQKRSKEIARGAR